MRHPEPPPPVINARFPGWVLCLCGHPLREHHLGTPQGGWRECRTTVPRRVFGSHRCPCVRFIEAPFAQQQLLLL
jgi:hypothetical protein